MRQMLAVTRRVLSIEDRNPTAFYLQAVLAARAGKYALSRALMQRTNGTLDDRPAAMLLVGAVEYRLGNVEQAIERLTRLVAIEPDNIKARRILAAAQWRAGDTRATIQTLQPIADRADAQSDVLTLIGRAYQRNGEHKQAASYLDRAAMPLPILASGPIDPREIAALQRRVASHPTATSPRIALIRALMGANRTQEALAEAVVLQRAHDRAPVAHVLVGDALAALGRFGPAADAYRRAAGISLAEPVAIRLIEALRASGQGEPAARILSTFLERNPQSTAAQRIAADFMMNAGQFARAAGVLEGLRQRLGDGDAALLNNLAWAYFQTGRSLDAVALARKAYALAPASPAVSDTYGWLLFQSGDDRERGLSLLEQAVAQAPRNAAVRWHLAQAYAAVGRNAEARAVAQVALALPGLAEPAKVKALLARL